MSSIEIWDCCSFSVEISIAFTTRVFTLKFSLHTLRAKGYRDVEPRKLFDFELGYRPASPVPTLEQRKQAWVIEMTQKSQRSKT